MSSPKDKERKEKMKFTSSSTKEQIMLQQLEQYTIQAKWKHDWLHVTNAPLFDTEDEARKWGQWNYR